MKQDVQDLLVGVATEFQESIQVGSAVTGAPGQPVQDGNLKLSYQLTFPERGVAEIASNAAYAQAIEDGTGVYGPLTLRAARGGFHSIKTSVASAQRVVDKVAKEINGG